MEKKNGHIECKEEEKNVVLVELELDDDILWIYYLQHSKKKKKKRQNRPNHAYRNRRLGSFLAFGKASGLKSSILPVHVNSDNNSSPRRWPHGGNSVAPLCWTCKFSECCNFSPCLNLKTGDATSH